MTTRVTGWAFAVAAVAGMLANLGCDPCSGVVDCTGAPQVSANGQVIVHTTFKPAPGVTLDLIRTDGPHLDHDSIRVTTDAEGLYQFRATATEQGTVTADIVVRPPDRASYRVPGVKLATSRVQGDGIDLGRWVVDPYIAFVGELHLRRGGVPVSDANVEFRRTGGIRIAPDPIGGPADPGGRFFLAPKAVEPGEVVGDLLIYSPHLARPYVLSGVRMSTTYTDTPPRVTGVFGVGPSLQYGLEFWYRGSNERVANADVQFQRTGGIAVDPPTFSAQTGADGRVGFVPVPLDEGEVVGDIVVRAPKLSRPFTITGVRLKTFDTDETRLLGVIGVGYQVAYGAEVDYRGLRKPAVGADVEFRRTGGVAITPSVLTAKADANGLVSLVAAAEDAGDVIGDLTVRPPAPYQPYTISGYKITAFAADASRWLDVFAVGYQLNYAGELFYRATGQRAEGIDVEYRRVGGVAITPDTLRVKTDKFGRFPIVAGAAVQGDVVGDIIVRPPPPAHTFTLAGVRLRTTDQENGVLFGVFGVGPSLDYAGQVVRVDTYEPIPGVQVEFRRTGGIAITPESFVTQTDAGGRFPFRLSPLDEGEVVGTLTLRPPAPFRDTTITNVRLATFEADQGRLREVYGVTVGR